MGDLFRCFLVCISLLAVVSCESSSDPSITPRSCIDGAKNGDESDIDCGGDCGACDTGKVCANAGNCTSGVCTASVCTEATCIDGVKNGDESDIDCGGDCGACDTGKICANAGDCLSGVCDDDDLCAEPTCSDGVQNGDESDLDCGGDCDACDSGKICANAGDCLSGVCDDDDLCAEPTCSDGVQNGDESGTDCGGNCDACSMVFFGSGFDYLPNDLDPFCWPQAQEVGQTGSVYTHTANSLDISIGSMGMPNNLNCFFINRQTDSLAKPEGATSLIFHVTVDHSTGCGSTVNVQVLDQSSSPSSWIQGQRIDGNGEHTYTVPLSASSTQVSVFMAAWGGQGDGTSHWCQNLHMQISDMEWGYP